MQNFSQWHGAMPTTTFDMLRRPLREEEQRALWGQPQNMSEHDLLAALQTAYQEGDEETSQAAAAMIYILIQKKMDARLMDPQNGAIPKFTDNLEDAVETFNGMFR